MGKNESRLARLLPRPWLATSAILVAELVTSFVPPAWPEQAQRPMQSVAEASRNARGQRASSVKQARLITNDDLREQNPAPNGSDSPLQSSPNTTVQTSTSPATECDNPEAAQLREELQASSQELDRVRSEFSPGYAVIFGNNLDLKSFKPGYAGLNVGAPPTLDSAPPVPARLTALQLEERVAALNEALRLACESPEAAQIQRKIDEAEKELEILQRQFVLDRDDHYSKPNYPEDTLGKARIDAELQEIADRQSDIARLRDELAAIEKKYPAF